MSYYQDHNHTTAQNYGGNRGYGVVVGTVDTRSMHTHSGEGGDHLIFFVQIGAGSQYQVDINTESKYGSEIEYYTTTETLPPQGGPNGFGNATFGESSEAQLSYAKLGLTDYQFTPIDTDSIAHELETALEQCKFVSVYGHLYDDGGPNGKGIHDTHYVAGSNNQDGAIAIYSNDANGAPVRTWFFFKFAEDHISN